MESYKNWNEMLKSKKCFSKKIESIKLSKLYLQDPGSNRQLYFILSVWMSLVDQTFSESYSLFYHTMKVNHQIEFSEGIGSKIREDIAKTILSQNNFEITTKIMLTLSIFFQKNPEMVYKQGMISLLSVIIKVFKSEVDIFIIFTHIIENIYPKDFFSTNQNSKIFFSELKTFCLLVEHMRPKISKALLLNTEGGSEKYAFETVIKRFAEHWYLNLFTTNFEDGNLFRIWDCVFIFGFDFVRKFGLALLSDLEKDFLISLNRGLPAFDYSTDCDSILIVGSDLTKKISSFKKIENPEKILNKAIGKQNYTALQIERLISEGEISEKNSEIRIERIRNLQKLFEPFHYSLNDYQHFFEILNRYDNDTALNRSSFCSFVLSNFSFNLKLSTSFFLTFDQKFSNILSILSVKLGFAILIKGVSDKAVLIKSCLPGSNDSLLNVKHLANICIKLEELLDIRNNFYKVNGKQFFKSYKTLKNQDFFEIFMEEQFFKGIKDILEYLDSSKQGDYKTLRNFSYSESTNTESESEELSDYIEEEQILFRKQSFAPRKKSRFLGFIAKHIEEKGNLSNHRKNLEVKPEILKTEEGSLKDLPGPEPEYLLIEENKAENQLDIPIENRVQFINFSGSIDRMQKATRNNCSRLCTNTACLVI